MDDVLSANKKYPIDAKSCLECVWYKNDSGHVKYCEVYKFSNMIPEFKNCDKSI